MPTSSALNTDAQTLSDWESLLALAAGTVPWPGAGPHSALLDLFLPLCVPPPAELPWVVGHVGQSLDGFIATAAGDSYYVTGPDNILHLHRLRALCDAVVVGAGTVQTDNPRLTTRLVSGTNPLRVVIDPSRRLNADRHVFSDNAASTVRVVRSGFHGGTAIAVEELAVEGDAQGLSLQALLHALRVRGCQRVFVEGGGLTVSAFLRAGLMDRLHVAVAPLLIGEGRPALQLPGVEPLAMCMRPGTRVFGMGADVLWDCDLRASAAPVPAGLQRLR